MNILIANNSVIPAFKYGGTERVIWWLGKELAKRGHRVTYLVNKGSYCDFARVIELDETKPLNQQIPDGTDIVHAHYQHAGLVEQPYVNTLHTNIDNPEHALHPNTIFVSGDHARRYGSDSFVYNGLDWDATGKPDLNRRRNHFHFLGKAAWRIKNVKGAIDVVTATPKERLAVLGGSRLNIKMGFRFTVSPRVSFYGMVGGGEKNLLLNNSKGLLFPVRWHEPFGLALIESLYFGCPVFGTPYGSLPEIVSKEFGHLSASADELSRAILQADSFDRAKCHQYAADVFNSGKMAEGYLAKYAAVLDGKSLNSRSPMLLQAPAEKFLPWY
jgi:glycosyltransferase involved in cell wall biosynthesis